MESSVSGGGRGRTAVVTGGTGALGEEVVTTLLERGWRVHVPWFAADEAEALRERVGDVGDALVMEEVDVTDPGAVEAFLDGVPVHGLCNLVGGFAMGALTDTDPGTWERMLRLNATSAFVSSRAAVARMRERDGSGGAAGDGGGGAGGDGGRRTAGDGGGAAGDGGGAAGDGNGAAGDGGRRTGESGRDGGGRIVNVTAFPAVERGAAEMSAYAASKAAVLSLTHSLSKELRSEGIGVNAIAPEIIDTPANREAMPDADRSTWLAPEEIARVVAFLLSDDAAVVTGSVLTLAKG